MPVSFVETPEVIAFQVTPLTERRIVPLAPTVTTTCPPSEAIAKRSGSFRENNRFVFQNFPSVEVRMSPRIPQAAKPSRVAVTPRKDSIDSASLMSDACQPFVGSSDHAISISDATATKRPFLYANPSTRAGFGKAFVGNPQLTPSNETNVLAFSPPATKRPLP